MKTKGTVALTSAQLWFLRKRYGKRKDTSADVLLKLAMLEVVSAQAEKESKESEIVLEND